MDVKRLLLIGVALSAGSLAYYLAMNASQPAPARAERVAAPLPAPAPVDVLVAARPLPVNSELAAGSLRWQPMPADRLPDGALTRQAEPGAIASLQTYIANHQIDSGEPVTYAKIQKAPEGNPLAARITPGQRAVSVPIDPKNVRAVGGFVFPNDRVDVAVTLPVLPNDSPVRSAILNSTPSRILLENIRVLAMGQNLIQNQIIGQKIALAEVATLEVTPDQASRLLAAMRESGAEVSLILRPAGDPSLRNAPPATAQIFTVRYGRVSMD